MINIQTPYAFLALIILPLLIWMYFRSTRSKTIGYSDNTIALKIKPSLRVKTRHVPFFLLSVVFILFVIALSRPQVGLEESKVNVDGVDIVLALDVSGSMQAEDFEGENGRENRLTVAKNAMKNFIKNRKNDRIGIVIFADEAFTQAPMTIDYNTLEIFVNRLEMGIISPNKTAIGNGLMTAIGRLDKSKAKSKIIVLLTDGSNNAGEIEPIKAAKAAAALDIKVYTIGAGKEGMVPVPVFDQQGNKRGYREFRSDLDTETLKNIAKETKGTFYRVHDTDELNNVYAEIDKLEKTKIETNVYYNYKEIFHYFLLSGIALLLLTQALQFYYYRAIP